ncbi:MAG: GTPase Era [Thiotrichaceae bacterium]
MQNPISTRCGYVALVGRPNVGKSTLLNHLIGQKLSITSSKPQTTRHRLLGIKVHDNTQILYVDTPGLHQDVHNAMNRYLNRTALSSVEGMDVIVWVVEASRWMEGDNYVLNTLRAAKVPVILAVNKIDKLADKTLLLPYLQEISAKREFSDIFPISALHHKNLAGLEQKIIEYLPNNDFLFPEDELTNRSMRFLAAELVREKLIRRLGAELPYRLTVQTEYFVEKENVTHISAVIWVERASQKPIVIGKQGSLLKSVGEDARKDIVELLGRKVYLQLWVKIKEGWSDDDRALQQLGYTD